MLNRQGRILFLSVRAEDLENKYSSTLYVFLNQSAPAREYILITASSSPLPSTRRTPSSIFLIIKTSKALPPNSRKAVRGSAFFGLTEFYNIFICFLGRITGSSARFPRDSKQSISAHLVRSRNTFRSAFTNALELPEPCG